MAAFTGGPTTTDGVLLVEGQDDKHVVWHLCRHEQSPFSADRLGYDLNVTLPGGSSRFQIIESGNRSELLKSIRQTVRSPNLRAFGILVDADYDCSNCWDQVLNAFSRTGIPLPPSPNPTGTVVPETLGQPRVGIWLMPDNKSPGEVEDFVRRMIPNGDAGWPLASNYIEGVPQAVRKFADEKTEKAKLYAWLSTQKEPARMGAAIGADGLEVNDPLCQAFLTWLAQLFS